MTLTTEAQSHASSLFDLSGKVAIVSGAAAHGRASAIALQNIGADLLLADLNEIGLKETAEQLASFGRKVVTSQTNVSEQDPILELFRSLIENSAVSISLRTSLGKESLGSPEELPLSTVEQCFRIWCSDGFACARMLAVG